MFKIPEDTTVDVISASKTPAKVPVNRKLRAILTQARRDEVLEAVKAYVDNRYSRATFTKYRSMARVLGVSVGSLDALFGLTSGAFYEARSKFGLAPIAAIYTKQELLDAWGPQEPVRYSGRPGRKPAAPAAPAPASSARTKPIDSPEARVNACSVLITMPDKQTLKFNVDSKDAADRMHRVLLALL